MAQSEIATKLRVYSIPVRRKNNFLFCKISILVQGPSQKLVHESSLGSEVSEVRISSVTLTYMSMFRICGVIPPLFHISSSDAPYN